MASEYGLCFSAEKPMKIVIQVATSWPVCHRLPWGIAAMKRPVFRTNVIMLYHYKVVFIFEQFVHGRVSLQKLGFSSKISMNLSNVRGKVVRD